MQRNEKKKIRNVQSLWNTPYINCTIEQHVAKYAKICKSVVNVLKACTKVQKHAKLYIQWNVPKFAKCT